MKNNQSQKLVLWVIWFTMFVAVFLYQFLLGDGIPSGEDSEGLDWIFVWLCLGSLAISTALRWIVVPRIKNIEKLLPVMIFGVAFAEAPEFFQIFLIGSDFPETQLSIFILTVLALLQWAPTYARRF